MNRIVDDYLLELRTRLSELPFRDQDAVLGEVRAHLAADIEDRRRKAPKSSNDELALAATAAFGDPDEIAVAFGPQGGLVRKRTGEVLLRAAVLTGRAARATGRAAGRGAKSTLKWAGIVAAVLLGVGLVILVVVAFVGVQLANTYKEEIVESVPHPIYDYHSSWALSSPEAGPKQDSFSVPSDSREFRIAFTTTPQAGCVAIQLTSPSGAVTAVNGNGCSAYSQASTFTEVGTWKVQYTYVAFAGTVSAHAEAYRKAT